jgi:hypothetical protein
MSDPLEKLLERQALLEPSGDLDSRVRRHLAGRCARLAWRRWGWAAAAATILMASLLWGLDRWWSPHGNKPSVAKADHPSLPAGRNLVAHDPKPPVSNDVVEDSDPQILIVKNLDSCTVIDLTGEVPLVSFVTSDEDSPTWVWVVPALPEPPPAAMLGGKKCDHV